MKTEFKLPEVDLSENTNHRTQHLQLLKFYKTVKAHEKMIYEWREDSKRVEAIIRNTSPCSVCKYNIKVNGKSHGCGRCGCGFAYLRFFSAKGLEAYRRESRFRADTPKPIGFEVLGIASEENLALVKMMAQFEKSDIEQIKAITRLEAIRKLNEEIISLAKDAGDHRLYSLALKIRDQSDWSDLSNRKGENRQ